ncbi:MAG: hypothetical protein AB7T03_06480 [Bacilli bacterium]
MPLFLEIILVYLLIVVYFTQDAIGAEVFEKKGYSRYRGALWCLIPVYGIIHCFRAPAIKSVQKGGLRQYFTAKEVLMKLVTFGELVLLAAIVIVPVVY